MEQDQQTMDEQGYIKGEILYTIFHNEAEHFSIIKIRVQDTNEDFKEKEIVAKGYFSNLQEQTPYFFYGTFERHARFGLQYKVSSYKTIVPNTKDGLVAYLSSDLFYGIGKKTAERIVEHLGETAITQILNDGSILQGVPGLKKETAERLASSIQENQGFEHIAVYLANYGVGLKMAQRIYKEYKDEAIEVLEEDPYQYVFAIEGFGFRTADDIARQNGLSMTHPNRIGAGCIYILQKCIQDGHVYIPIEFCVDQVGELLSIHSEEVRIITEQMEELNKEKKVIMKDTKVYLPSLYYAEDGFAANLKRIMEKPIKDETPLAEMMKITGDIEESEVLSYGKEQFSAINQSLHSKVMILTGGPGTGKTTVIKGILKAYATIHDVSLNPKDYDDPAEFPFVLTAPTGRAAKRLNESTGLPALTIHRLLGWNGSNGFNKDEQEQLSGKILIVDEFSMVDIWLANSLFKAIPDEMQVLLVGDEDQLPSVGPGQVLTDLLNSKLLPLVRLNEVYRQKEGSKIIQLAHEIKNNQLTVQSLQNDKDFSFIACNEHQMLQVVTSIFTKAKEKGLDVKEIQVLAPMYRSQAGITMINQQLQQLINPKTKTKREVKYHDVVYRVGDKVIQLVNQPEDGVYNGDIGEVVAIFREEENVDNVEQVVIAFDDKEVVYERNNYINFTHAYCISIHKSQGSEFPIVILPVVSTYYRMLRKNLLYTAITRSKESLIICGEQQAFLKGIQTMDTNKRYTSLKEQLSGRMKDLKMEEAEEVDEEEISPYDFM
ncbi:SF1B family DNA helicase RecD2 [Oceanobacillus profundus]|uniref:ATP-dependent RecD2 DNA helicase n=1 Tax=Oceanobacillus profundus TaxID=372463 RepID=A0A417YJ18_9BACI|nr:ATP-dependent RecD-like DNA helicase [Oceanobacillus profundus]MBR3118368.1 ATP-dependent RecD-like DNA helicase [Oceanobacillus sp.]MCM3396937.1 ATP-dependent RecD-like DNA helicase [Oceanobacillus profundus]RHW33075.1 ATP-dependent RecD-like DNA helicase [Oceanobacillus profundus]